MLNSFKQFGKQFSVQGFSSSFIAVVSTQIGGMILGYAVSIFLSNQLSEGQFGLWSYLFQSIIPIAIVLVLYGNHHFIVRELTQLVSLNQAKQAWAVFKQSIGWSLLILFAFGIFFLVSFPALIESQDFSFRGAFLTILIVGLFAAGRIRQSYQQVVGQSSISQIPERILLPLFFLIGTWGWLTFYKTELVVDEVLLIYTICFLTVILGSLTIIKKLRSTDNARTSTDKLEEKTHKTRKYFFLLGVVDIIDTNVDLILLKELAGFEEIAYFSVAKRISFLLNLILFSTNYTLFPTASALFSQGKKMLVQRQIYKIVKVNTVIASAGVVVLLLLKPWILGLFGDSYESEISWSLYGLLLFVQWINILLGVPSLVMNISGNEKYSLVVFLGGILLQIGLAVAFIPQFGIIGMAWVHLINTIFWNLTLGFVAKKKTGLNVTFLIQ
jgi:O-antigen/teichoic acid export membrane protein